MNHAEEQRNEGGDPFACHAGWINVLAHEARFSYLVGEVIRRITGKTPGAFFGDEVAQQLEQRIRDDLQKRGDFARIHPLPRSGADVPDDLDARLVVLPAEQPYSREPGNAAETAAREILAARGNAPRIYQNTLVFLAADKVRLQDLDEAVRKYLAWESILDEKESLNLDPHQVRQAETQRQAADGAVTARLTALQGTVCFRAHDREAPRTTAPTAAQIERLVATRQTTSLLIPRAAIVPPMSAPGMVPAIAPSRPPARPIPPPIHSLDRKAAEKGLDRGEIRIRRPILP